MGLGGKLQRWVDAGLITNDQRSGILAHEKGGTALRWKYGLGMSGLFSIFLGIALIVAANWQGISDTIKLGAHLLANITLSVLVWQWHGRRDRYVHCEVALFALWGLTLTLIALIGQIFQLGGDAHTALRLWFWLTSPMILLFAQGSYIARLWAIAFVLYVPFDMVQTAHDLTDNESIRIAVSLAAAVVMPFVAWLLGAWPRFAVNRPTMARTLRQVSLFIAILGASASGILFYVSSTPPYAAWIAPAFAVLVVVLRFAIMRLRAWDADARRQIDLLALSGLWFCLPMITLVDSNLMGLVHFLSFWILAGWMWQNDGHDRLVSLAIFVITLRLFMGFMELFGSMMMSGLGFIVVGVVLLALVKLARYLDRRLKGVRAA